MNGSDIFVKTARGADELRTRSAKLPQRLRTILIMVDGVVSAADLQRAAATLGAPEDCVDSLLSLGLIERVGGASPLPRPVAAPPAASTSASAAEGPAPSEAELFRVARSFMNDTAVDALGFRAFFFTLKLEKCGQRSDLSALMPDYLRVIEKGNGEQTARVLEVRLREMLR